MFTLLSMSIALLAGLLMTRLFRRIKLPAVTAYLISGIIVGPYLLGRLNVHGIGFGSMVEVENLALICEVALGFIAFSIGNEFRLNELKKTGKQACLIGIVQALFAALLVVLALVVVHIIMPDKITITQALTLGAIATATAPAATLMVVREYKADGPLTRLLLPIVALDDAVGLIVFAVLFGISKTIVNGSVDLFSIIVNPIVEIVSSLLLGAILGYLLTQLTNLFKSRTNKLNLTIAFVLLTVSLSMLEFNIGSIHVSFSALLVCMMLGTIFCNTCSVSSDLMGSADKWTSPLFALFFVISGAELELNVFTDISIVLIGLVYIIFRSLGKYLGSYFSAKMSHCEPSICKYLGITLLPQAGVALGMCITAMQLGKEGNLIRNITLFAILIYELLGPIMTREALTKAGDIKPKELSNKK